jgi:hypothetical protein
VRFSLVSNESGIGEFISRGQAIGVAAADFDNDGDIDFYAPTDAGVQNQLYRNLGDGTFEESGAEAGVDSLLFGRVAIWFDYDGDHRLDLLVGGDCFARSELCAGNFYLTLYRQTGDAQFLDVTAAAGITEDLVDDSTDHRAGMAVGDINNDGYLDVVLGMWAFDGQLLLNDGDGTFTDASAGSGLESGGSRHWMHTLHDFDGDGWLDIHTAVDMTENKLLVNQQDNTFQDVAGALGTDNPWDGMGTALGDYDNDGDIDIYVTNIFDLGKHNVLYRNDTVGSTLAFTEVSEALGVDNTDWGWGCTFFDADNDGFLDLAATNGFVTQSWTDDPSRFFLNQGMPPYQFTDVSSAVGFSDTLIGSSLVAFDYDRDGDLDMLQSTRAGQVGTSTLRLLQNDPIAGETTGNYLVVKPRMDGPNHWAIGAVVRATVGELTMTRLITAGISFVGQEPAEAFFGLGLVGLAEQVVIEWPDGTQSLYEDIPANDIYTVIDGALIGKKTDTDGDGLLDLDEFELGTDRLLADTDGDGVSDKDELDFGSDPLDEESVVSLSTSSGPLLALCIGAILALFVVGRPVDPRVGRRS